jgi:hypothetical protein
VAPADGGCGGGSETGRVEEEESSCMGWAPGRPSGPERPRGAVTAAVVDLEALDAGDGREHSDGREGAACARRLRGRAGASRRGHSRPQRGGGAAACDDRRG